MHRRPAETALVRCVPFLHERQLVDLLQGRSRRSAEHRSMHCIGNIRVREAEPFGVNIANFQADGGASVRETIEGICHAANFLI